jgi:hypothetical protein
MVEILASADGVATAVAFLRAQFTDRGETAIVGSKIRDPRPAKFVKVRLMGTSDQDVVRSAPMLTFECWAATDIDAWNLGKLTEALVTSMPDLLSACTRVVNVGGLVEQPDPDSGSPRYVFTKQIYLAKSVLT